MEGSLSDQKTREVQEHLESCEACSVLLNNVEKTYEAFDNLSVPGINPYLSTKIEARLKKNHLQIEVARLPFRRVFPKVAAGAIIVIGIVLGIFVGGQMKYLHTANKDGGLNEVVEMYTDVYSATDANQNTDAIFTNE
jgi:anti-sigma factor RsiW